MGLINDLISIFAITVGITFILLVIFNVVYLSLMTALTTCYTFKQAFTAGGICLLTVVYYVFAEGFFSGLEFFLSIYFKAGWLLITLFIAWKLFQAWKGNNPDFATGIEAEAFRDQFFLILITILHSIYCLSGLCILLEIGTGFVFTVTYCIVLFLSLAVLARLISLESVR